VLGETEPELAEIFRAKPNDGVIERNIDFECASNQLALGGRVLDLRTPTSIYTEVFVPLHGRHQGDNAAAALAAVESFFGAPLSSEVVEEGFAAVRWPGRLEVLGHQPLVVIDGAHNPHGADACANVLADDFDPAGRRILVVGFLKSQDPRDMLAALRADEADLVVVCTPPSPRAIPAAETAAAAKALGCDNVVVVESVAGACDHALESAEGDDAIMVTGSLYVVGEARPHLKRVLERR
jgi:dihydrofolate synthase / folylpolyglutamate synthase